MEEQASYNKVNQDDQVRLNHLKVGDCILEAIKNIDQAIILINAMLPDYDYQEKTSELLEQKSKLKNHVVISTQ
mgnify:CR=1 FL=1